MKIKCSMWRTRLLAVVLALFALQSAGPARSELIVLSLEKAIELGLENDEGLRQATEAVEGARGLIVSARSAALPHLTISGQYGRNILLPTFFLPEEFRDDPDAPAMVEMGEDNDFLGTVTLTQILWAAGRVSAGLTAAKEYLGLYKMQKEVVTDFVRFSVQQAYFNVLLAEETLRISEKAMEATEEAVRVARRGFENGTVSRFDLLRSEVELENRRAPLVAARNDIDQAFLVIRRRCGFEHDAEVTLTDSLYTEPIEAVLAAFLASMLEGSAELKALNHNIAAKQQFHRIAKAERYPMMTMSAYYGIQTQWSEGWTPPSELVVDLAAVQVGLQIPIFDGLRARGNISRAEADLRSAEIEFERVTREKELAVRRSWLTLENALTALNGRREAVDLAEEAYRLA
ncbi:MAG: TolC family protein, partial [Candidatus Krumholzibacteria bacterium]|nr:TolC family protein [Candidatus Krumholzibacteria bacterium]